MTTNTYQNGYSLFIVGTSEVEILQALVNQRYPKPVAMAFNATDSTYHVIAYRLQ